MTRYILPIAVVLLMVAAGLRFHALDQQSFWNDEGNSYGQSLRSPADIAINAAADIHPPGYYWMLAGWRVLTGESEFALRSLSVFASVLSAACAFALARRLFGCTAGLVTLTVVAVNTFSITYAQEARMYALLALWGAASTWALVAVLKPHPPAPEGELNAAKKVPSQIDESGAAQKVPSLSLMERGFRGEVAVLKPHPPAPSPWGEEELNTTKKIPTLLDESGAAKKVPSLSPMERGFRGEVALALTTAAGLYTNYAYAGVLALHAVIGLAYLIFLPVRADSRYAAPTRKTLLIRLTVAYGIALALFLPWLPTALRQVTSWGSTGDPIPAAQAIPVALGYLVTGNTYTVTGISTAAALLLVMGLMPTAGKRPADRQTLWALMIPPLWVILTVGGFLALGLFRPANLKFLLPAQIGMALWIGRGGWAMWHLQVKRDSRAARLAPKFAAMAATTAILFGGWGGLNALYTAPEFQRDDYRGIVQAILAENSPDPAIILNGAGQREVFDYNALRAGVDFETYPLPVGLSPDRETTEQALRAILSRHDRIYGVFWGTDERDPDSIVEKTLAAHAYQLDDRWYGSVRLVRYIAPQTLQPIQEVGKNFSFDGGVITLHTYRLNQTETTAGGVLTVELDWSTDAPVPLFGVVTVQFLAMDGTLITQHDSQPVSGLYPTTTWIPGERYTDRHALMIPDDLPAAQYQLIVALYTPQNGSVRLPVNGEDALMLAEISVR